MYPSSRFTTPAWPLPPVRVRFTSANAPRPIADAILTLLADPARAAAMGASGRARVADRFTWPAIAARTEAAYEIARLA